LTERKLQSISELFSKCESFLPDSEKTDKLRQPGKRIENNIAYKYPHHRHGIDILLLQETVNGGGWHCRFHKAHSTGKIDKGRNH
jgi:hypothetical protein